jgi:hypothetical protein
MMLISVKSAIRDRFCLERKVNLTTVIPFFSKRLTFSIFPIPTPSNIILCEIAVAIRRVAKHSVHGIQTGGTSSVLTTCSRKKPRISLVGFTAT